jgi:hypothetical protein
MSSENCPFEVTPYDKSGLIKTPNLSNLNYTNQDFWSMKSRLIDFIQEKFGDSFSDFVESDLAIMLIENWAFIADTLSFKIDQIANEIFIDTVSEVDNAFRLSMLVGFKPQPPIGAKSLWSATISNALETNLIINTPVSIQILTESGIRFVELWPADQYNNPIYGEDIVINSGTFLTTAIVGVEGRTFIETVRGTGLPNQFIPLTEGSVIWNSIKVRVDGIEWNQVDFFTDSQPRKEFRIEYDANYSAYVLFGNNRGGFIPSINSDIEIEYRSGGGVVGNIVTGSVEVQKGYPVPGFNIRIPVTFRNYTKGENGYAGDTIEDIKRKLPKYLRTQNRLVSGDDIESFASQFSTEFNGQIGKAKAVLRNYGCAANVVDLYILSRFESDGLTKPDEGIKVALKEAIEDKKMITDFICIKEGVIVEVDTTIDVLIDKFYRKFEEEFREKINQRISSFYSLNNWDYGKTLKSVDLIKSMSNIPEIKSVEVNLQTNNENNSGEIVTTRYYEIIRPSINTVNFVYE